MLRLKSRKDLLLEKQEWAKIRDDILKQEEEAKLRQKRRIEEGEERLRESIEKARMKQEIKRKTFYYSRVN
jgi:hypothetical protein